MIATYDDAHPGSPAVLAIAHGFLRNLPKTILASVVIGFVSSAIALAIGIYVGSRRRIALGLPILPNVSTLRMLLALNLDFVTAFLLSVFITELSTDLLAKGGLSLPVWPLLLILVIMVGYFVLSHWLFGRTLWQRILKARRRPGVQT